MPLRVATGFDHWLNVSASWTKANAGVKLADVVGTVAPSISTVDARTGTQCIRLTATAGDVRLGWDTNTLAASQTRGVAVLSVRFPSSLPAGDVRLAQFTSPTSLNGELWYHASTGKLATKIEGGSFVDGPTISANTYYTVELYYNCSANPQTLDWAVDGTAYSQATGAGTASTIGGFNLGGRSDTPQTIDIEVDDVAIWTDTAAITFPVGKHKVVLLIPDTGGTTTQYGTANRTARFTGNATADATHNSADILAALSEVPPTIGATASGVCQRVASTVADTDGVGIPMTTYTLQTGESASGLQLVIVGWAGSATANSLGIKTYNGTTLEGLTAGFTYDPNFDNNTTTPGYYRAILTAGNYDSQAEIDAWEVRLGYSDDIVPLPGAHAVYGELLVKEATSSIVSLDGSGAAAASASGDFIRKRGIAGSGPAAASAAGALDALRPIAGAGSASASAQAGLDAARAFAGLGSCAASASGDLTVTAGGAAVALDGSGSAAGSGQGILATERALVGSGGASAAGNGAFSVERSLAGAGSAAASGVGALDSLRELAGSGSCAAGASGDLSIAGQVALAGSGSAAGSAQGSLQAARLLAGSGSAAGEASGSLTVTAPSLTQLAGIGSAAAGASGSLETIRPLAGVGAAAAGASASLSRDRPLAGASGAAASATGDLTVEGPPTVILERSGSQRSKQHWYTTYIPWSAR